jgi:hypothetical protein
MSGIGDSVRLSALRDVQLLDQPSIESLDRYVRIARAALGVPVALVSLARPRPRPPDPADDTRSWMKGSKIEA